MLVATHFDSKSMTSLEFEDPRRRVEAEDVASVDVSERHVDLGGDCGLLGALELETNLREDMKFGRWCKGHKVMIGSWFSKDS